MPVERVGVVGAGTMGAGIAQIAALGGYETLLYEIDEKQLERGMEMVRNGMRRGAERGRWSESDAPTALERVRTDTLIELLSDCELVIEAAPEDLDLKRNLFERLASVCGPETVLATNTSSLSVTAIASAVPEPQRIVRHALLQPAGPDAARRDRRRRRERRTGARARHRGRRAAWAGRRSGPATRSASSPTAASARSSSSRCGCSPRGSPPHDEIDRIVRLGAGLRMGPFELMDLIGIDVNFAVARSFWEQSFGEPRWRPSPIHERMVASGRLGRKTGRGFYAYETGEPHRPRDPDTEGERPIFDEDELETVAGPNAPRC